jgi:hypothetical protein
MPKENNHSLGENSPNLVTLIVPFILRFAKRTLMPKCCFSNISMMNEK